MISLKRALSSKNPKREYSPSFNGPSDVNQLTVTNLAVSYIHWISDCPSLNSPIKASVRVHNPLFTCDNPDTHPSGFLSVVNPRSEEVFPGAMVEIGFHEVRRTAPWPKSEGEKESEDSQEDSQKSPECVRFQGMRVAYFCLDRDSSADSIVLYRIVSLKVDSKK
jgi:glutaminyl-tRNA synthetase